MTIYTMEDGLSGPTHKSQHLEYNLIMEQKVHLLFATQNIQLNKKSRT